VNRLWKKLDRLEHEKRNLQTRLNENGTNPVVAAVITRPVERADSSEKVASHVKTLKREVDRLRKQLSSSSTEHTNQMKAMESEEKSLREKNLQLQRKLQMEIERREALHRHLSESESSLEMDEERIFNHEISLGQMPRGRLSASSPGPFGTIGITSTISSTSSHPGFIPNASSAFTTPVSPYRNNTAQTTPSSIPQRPSPRPATTPDRFVKPSPPPSPGQNRSKEFQ